MASTHPITGVTTLIVVGEQRTIAFDMNAAAALHESKGADWNEWLVRRFLGEEVVGTDGQRRVEPLTPADTITALYGLLATDREDSGRLETEKLLRRAVSPAEMPDIQLALVKCVLAGFGLPGEVVEAVASAVDTPRVSTAPGTGTKRSVSPSVPFKSTRGGSGGSPSRSGGRSSRATRTG